MALQRGPVIDLDMKMAVIDFGMDAVLYLVYQVYQYKIKIKIKISTLNNK